MPAVDSDLWVEPEATQVHHREAQHLPRDGRYRPASISIRIYPVDWYRSRFYLFGKNVVVKIGTAAPFKG